MGGPPPLLSPIAKGPVPFCLEEVSKRSDARARLQKLRADILGLGPTFGDFAAVFEADLLALEFPNPAPIKAHLEAHWFDATSPYFPGVQVAEIYAKGVLHALDVSLDSSPTNRPPLEIEAWWLVDQPAVQMLTLLSPSNRLSLHILTPRPAGVAGSQTAILGQYSSAWITTSKNGTIDTNRFDGVLKAPSP